MDSDDDSGDDATFKPKKEVGGYDFLNCKVSMIHLNFVCLLKPAHISAQIIFCHIF
jgi:hypothetical protein